MTSTTVKSSWKKDSESFYSLQDIFNLLNQEFFSSKLQTKIFWARQSKTKARCYRRLGCFIPSQNIIKINPILNDKSIPDYFIRYIVYHEMLHAVYPPIYVGGRRYIHHKKFLEMEQAFPDYIKAKHWEKLEGKQKFF
jgi:predicted SprT family Zn-dependent metalloprotease